MKIAFIKMLPKRYQYTHSVTFDYLTVAIKEANPRTRVKVCFSFEDIKSFNPDVLGISTVTQTFMEAKKLAKRVKEELPDTTLLLGGTHISALPSTLPPEFDGSVIGEGEYAMAEIVKTGWVSRPIETLTPDMDKTPIPTTPPKIQYDFGEGIAILTTRGCVNRCVHCSEAGLWKPFRFLSAERIVKIMDIHHQATGLTDFVFLDDLSVYDLDRLVRIRDILIAKDLIGKFHIRKVACNSELVTEDIVKILKQLGVRLAGFGLESASPRILKTMKCNKVEVDDFIRAIVLFGKYGIRSGASTVWGFPGETLEDMEMTKDFLVKWNGQYGFRSFCQYVCQPLPGSPLWKMMLKQGKVSLDMDFSRIQIQPNLDDPNWLYINEDTVPRDKFVAFIKNVQKEIKR